MRLDEIVARRQPASIAISREPDSDRQATCSPAEVERRAQRALAVPLLRFLNVVLADPVEGIWSITLVPSSSALNALNALHGGVIATLLDVAAYLAVVPQLAEGEDAVTIAFAASYVAAAGPNDQLRTTGCFIRRTRHLAFASAELRGESGLLALASVTKAVRCS
jgi:uncharacterized protein (TIGR00369 family)